MTWDTSNRRAELPSNWPELRADAKARARGRCQAEEHHPKCCGWGSECDHIGDKDDHSPANLRWLSKPCHMQHTQKQAAAARLSTKRRPELHPGLA